MVRLWGSFGRDSANGQQREASNPDSVVRRLEPWLIRLAFVVTAFGLLATSDVSYGYTFAKHVDAPGFELGRDTPRASFLVRARATGLGPERTQTTANALAGVQGHITSTGVDGKIGALVNVALDGGADGGGSELNVVSDFRAGQAVRFSGDCETFSDASPCEAEFQVHFERTDQGAAGGSMSIEWWLDFETSIEKSDEPDEGPIELPWIVEVVPL